MEVFFDGAGHGHPADLLPGSIVGNACQEYMDADYDGQSNQREQADGYQKNPEHIHRTVATVSIVVSAYLPPGHPRNITDRGYGGADDLPQSAVTVDVRTLFPLPMSLQLGKMREHPIVPGNPVSPAQNGILLGYNQAAV